MVLGVGVVDSEGDVEADSLEDLKWRVCMK